MAKIPGTVALTGIIAPSDDQDNYAVHSEEYGRGGFRSVLTATDRDNIPPGRQKEGMLVFVLSDATLYQFIGGVWIIFLTGSSGIEEAPMEN